MMNTIQRQLLLKPGASGVWTQECQSRLEGLLARPHAGKAQQCLAIEDKKKVKAESSWDSS